MRLIRVKKEWYQFLRFKITVLEKTSKYNISLDIETQKHLMSLAIWLKKEILNEDH